MKNDYENDLVEMEADFVEWLFEMEDLNKDLKYNATTAEQYARVEKLEKQLNLLKNKLYVPNDQLENI